MKAAGGLGHGAKSLNECRQHLAHVFLRLHRAGFGLGLLKDHVFQALLDIVKPADLVVDVTPRIKTLNVSEPPKRGAGVKVPDVATLVNKLKNEAKVI